MSENQESEKQEKKKPETEKGYGIRSPKEDPGDKPPVVREKQKQKGGDEKDK